MKESVESKNIKRIDKLSLHVNYLLRSAKELIVQTARIDSLISVASSTANKETEIDFADGDFEKIFTVTDSDCTVNSKIIAVKAIKSPSDGRYVDEVYVEELDIAAKSNAGNLKLYIKSRLGKVFGKFIINYSVTN